jgi:predicted molibdopterin-dependent oxidoreductase YjgC
MPELVTITVDGVRVDVAEGTSVAAALMIAGKNVFRSSSRGMGRGPLCGIGICFECRITVDGKKHARSCQLPCRSGMNVETDN